MSDHGIPMDMLQMLASLQRQGVSQIGGYTFDMTEAYDGEGSTAMRFEELVEEGATDPYPIANSDKLQAEYDVDDDDDDDDGYDDLGGSGIHQKSSSRLEPEIRDDVEQALEDTLKRMEPSLSLDDPLDTTTPLDPPASSSSPKPDEGASADEQDGAGSSPPSQSQIVSSPKL
jgi:hypothetical protein